MTAWFSGRKQLLVATALFSTLSIGAQAQYSSRSPDPGAIIGGVLGILGEGARQQQLQQQQQQFQQQQQLQQQQAMQRQQQIDADHQRAIAAAQAEAARRQADTQAEKNHQQQLATKVAADAKAKADAEEKRRLDTANKLRADPVFATILGTDGQDTTALIVGSDTPNVIRNLKGDPVFQNGATACLPFGVNGLDQRFLADVKTRIEKKGGLVSSSLLLTSCNPTDLAGYEVLIFSHSQIAGGTLEILDPLANALRNRQFVPLGTYTIAEFRAAEAAKADAIRHEQLRQEAERMDALKAFQTRDPSIVSVIHTEAPADVVCIASPDPEGVRYLLKRAGSPFARTIAHTSAFRDYPSSDAIFIAFKRKECTAAAAPAEILRDVMAGLIRDGFKVQVDAGSITADQLADWRRLSAEELATAQRQQAEDLERQRRQDAERADRQREQAQLDVQRQQNDEVARREELDRMRKQVVSKATAAMDDFGHKLQKHVASVVTEVNDTQQRGKTGQVLTRQEQGAVQAKYENDRFDSDYFVPWQQQVSNWTKERWEFSSPTFTIEDYGRVQWKQRTIEAITVKVEFQIVNRKAGDKQQVCEAFTWINDEEFSRMRETQMVPCADYEHSFDAWKQAHSFVSQWKLLPPAI